MSKAPPVLHFDDGSRVMKEGEVVATSTSTTNASTSTLRNPRGQTPIEIYYEIDRISSEIVQDILPICSGSHEDGFLCKVALQFPDELLPDTSQVSWLVEDAVLHKYQAHQQGSEKDNNDHAASTSLIPLIFVLGDTTYASCCPDEIGAHHLSADVIVHFGQYACLSISDTLPVIYSFGIEEWDGEDRCTAALLDQIKVNSEGKEEKEKIILVCERRYHHHMNKIAERLQESGLAKVVMGSIPLSQGSRKNSIRLESCCQGNRVECSVVGNVTEICQETSRIGSQKDEAASVATNMEEIGPVQTDAVAFGCIIGGLHIHIPPSALSEYRLIFIGDDSGYAESRQFLNTILKCTSPESQTKSIWSFNPSTHQVSTDPMSALGVSRYLNRRFYLTQKAKMANIMGILVGTLSQDRFRSVVASVRHKIEASGRACYTFVVGKINVAKLANFAEVECFVLVACGETSILRDEREFHVPIITPTELEIALGEKEWAGGASCNTDFGDFLQNSLKDEGNDEQIMDDDVDRLEGECGFKDDTVMEEDNDSDSDDDEPFFSMISGTYVSKPVSLKKQRKSQQSSNNSNLEALPGQGQITEYRSEAAEFWKKREYKGLEAQIGKDEAKAATEGQTGIASDYGK